METRSSPPSGAIPNGVNRPGPGCLCGLKDDGVDVPAVVRLATVGGAAEAVEALRLGIGTQAHILDPGQPRFAEAIRGILENLRNASNDLLELGVINLGS